MKSKPNILLIEDNEADAVLVREGLSSLGCDVNLIVIDNGLHVGDYLQNYRNLRDDGRPDLIIMDLNLPSKDGKELLVEIKGQKDLRTIPIIIMTTSSSQKDIDFTYESLANCFIEKPMDYEDFLVVLKSIYTYWFEYNQLPTFIN